MENSPAISVILATSGRFQNVRATVSHLRRQTVARQIELLIVTPEAATFGFPDALRDLFNSIKLVSLPQLISIDRANAEAVSHCTAPIVAFVEDHVFPQPEWAKALIMRYGAGDYSAVGPVVRNANPATSVSWADFLLSYGPWADGATGGDTAMLPGHNSSYRRSVLLEQGDRLAELLEAESVFHDRLRQRGARLFVEPRAVISHLNFARLDVLLRVQFHYGRSYGAARARDWPAWKRILYFVASPLIPVVRLTRVLRQASPTRERFSRLGVLIVLIPDLICDAIGQALGYTIGAGNSAKFLMNYEFDRVRFVTPADRAAIDCMAD